MKSNKLFHMVGVIAVICIFLLVITSCASKVGGQATLSDSDITTNGEPAKSQLIVSSTGITGNNNGIAPSGFLLDGKGAYAGMPGPASLFNLNKAKETINLVTANDGMMEVEDLEYSSSPTSGTLLTASRFRMEIRITDNIEQQRLTFEEAAETIQDIAPEQRLETVQQWEAAGRITSDVAAQLVRAFIPAP